ncbi:MAG: energy-coupling factor transporter ATPase [Oscillospiraceae bacterium]|jgi:energy-coupling factor transport system ATP-binding protein|nr:energy-coupling factor transporter ATPase [Oscillospiraceae bacterium]
MPTPLIDFQNVSFTYAGEGEEQPAVRELSFALGRGEFVAMLGHNGSGKSTAAKLCNGLLLPGEGKVLVDGLDTADEENLFEIRRRVGMVFQNPDNQIIAAIVEDDVAFGPENLCLPPEEIRQRVDKALQAVGMFEHRLAEPHKLSGGQKQRVAIAGVLAMQNECIVLDEATAMLDPRGRREVMEAALRLHREKGITVLLITHFMEEAALADRVLVLDEGRLLLSGAPREVFAQEAVLHQAGVALPAPARLAAALRPHFPGLPQGILTEEACAAAIAQQIFTPGEFRCPSEDVIKDAIENSEAVPPQAIEKAIEKAIETAVIRLEGLHFRYPNSGKGAPHALEGVDLSVAPGELLAIIGHTGSGKSTLVQHLNALLKPTQGSVFVEGKNIWANKKSIREARFRVGLCFQYPEYQLFEETTEKDVAYGPKNMGLGAAEIRERVLRAAALVGLEESLLAKSPLDLSGGEKRRAAVAGVIAMEPHVLVLDEPTAGLDPRGRAQMIRMIRRYRQETGRTVLLISHSMEDVAELADRVLVMHQGKAALHGAPAQVFARAEELTAMDLDVPTVTRIFLMLRALGVGVRADVLTMEQAVDALLRLRGAEGGRQDA